MHPSPSGTEYAGTLLITQQHIKGLKNELNVSRYPVRPAPVVNPTHDKEPAILVRYNRSAAHVTGRSAQKDIAIVAGDQGLVPGTIKQDTVSPTVRHSRDLSTELCLPRR